MLQYSNIAYLPQLTTIQECFFIHSQALPADGSQTHSQPHMMSFDNILNIIHCTIANTVAKILIITVTVFNRRPMQY